MEKPILFNTEMVKAILEGRKTQTRRLCKIRSIIDFRPIDNAKCMTVEFPKRNYKGPCANFFDAKGEYLGASQTPAQPGDILWVRETWKQYTTGTAGAGLIDGYLFKADEPQDTTGMMVEDRWHPSIHMPRKAARIFLRVKEVRPERLHEIMDAPPGSDNPIVKEGCTYGFEFIAIWDNTINPAERSLYGWNANPWVWVIEFERLEGYK